jgi:hypothetical protein
MKKKTEVFSSPKAKRAEIEEILVIAQKLTDAGYGYIWFTLVTEDETDRKKEFGYEE